MSTKRNSLIYILFCFIICSLVQQARAGSVVAWGTNGAGACNIPSPNSGFIAIAAGVGHSLGLKQDGSIVAWGWNNFGECNIPSPNSGFIAIAAGAHHSLGLKQDGSIVAWGYNGQGECNIPSPNSGFIAIAAGGDFYGGHSLGLKQDGSIVAWGANGYGQCNIPSPNSGFIAIAAGRAGVAHSLGLKQDGSIVAWGDNWYGECNIPSPNSGFIAISAGGYHSLGLKQDGSIVAWGDNYTGQCNIPSPNSGFIAISAGREHSLGLKQDGSIVAWGDNSYGQCNIPSANSGFIAIAAGWVHSLGLRSGKQFMLTFDDGPVPGNTENIVNALKNIYVGSEPVKAGFFMVGVGCCEDSNCYCPCWDPWNPKGSVRANHDLVQMVAQAGHFIGVHTQHHPIFKGWFCGLQFEDWSVKEIMLEISQCYEEIKKALNPNEPNDVNLPKIFRPPYFCNTRNVRDAARELDFQIILGAGDERADTVDVGGKQWTKACHQIQAWHRDEPCVLVFHDTSPSTHKNIAEIIDYLRKKGFTLVHFDPNRLPKEPDSVVHHATNTIHQSETVMHTVSLDSTVSTATFNVSWEGSDLDLVLYKPDGTKIDSNSAMVDPNIKYAERDTYEYYTISNPNSGDWVMEVLGVNVPPEGEKYTIRVEADSNLALFAFTDKPDYGLNEQISIRAELVNDQNSVTGALVIAKVQRPDGSVDNLILYDDGTHGDKDPNDGFYANAYNNTSLRGSYEITVSAIGELTGEQYERASSLTVMVGSIIYGNVDFGAYAVFADHWLAQNCTEPAWCDTADIDQSGEVDIFDLGALVEHWLEGTAP
jgi:peptidoglycan/xylan/chitin deacetylase (PgdA/CDA1 family)